MGSGSGLGVLIRFLPMRIWLQRGALLAVGFFAAFVLLELGLRVASSALRQMGSRSEEAPLQEGRSILCVGDSHTYGTSVPREGSYPAQLQAYLNRVDPEGRYTVINRGAPGMNSAQAAHLLPWLLHRYDPDIAVVWAGINDAWNRDDPEGGEASLESLLGWSRLYRLLVVLLAEPVVSIDAENPEQFKDHLRWRSYEWRHAGRRTGAELLETLTGNLERMARTLDEAGRPWILVTYPLEGYGPGHIVGEPLEHVDLERALESTVYRPENIQAEAVRRLATHVRLPAVHTRSDLERARAHHPEARLVCLPSETEGSTCLLIRAMGPHPTALVYGFIAESIGERLLDVLACAGPCERREESDPKNVTRKGVQTR